MATNRNAISDEGEKHEAADYHRLVSFGKLAELCAEYLKKGRKIYVEGRLQSRVWTDNEGQTKALTEIVLVDMSLLDSKPQAGDAEVTNLKGEQRKATM